jgi:hypothetical protein
MRSRPVLAALACLLMAASPASAQRQRSNESWGKSGASYLQYRTDAVECAYAVGQETPVDYPLVDLVFAENLPSPNPDDPVASAQTVIDQEKANFSRPWREISGQLRPALAQCLNQRGYHRFRLTKDQVDQLKKLPAGSRARNVYLWNLSVAPAARR